MDRLSAEREQMLTVEVNNWAIRSPGREIELVDAPGHRRFLKNMATAGEQY
jgi:translation elongation factor EF-1alpha